MAGAVDVVSHTEIEGGRNGYTALHSSYSTTSVTLRSWGGGERERGVAGEVGGASAPVSLWQSCDSSSEMDIQGSILLNIPELLLHRELPLS